MIPCSHAITCMRHIKKPPKDYVYSYYRFVLYVYVLSYVPLWCISCYFAMSVFCHEQVDVMNKLYVAEISDILCSV